MPITLPKPNEKENDYISRCVSSISDEYEQKQAVAICFDTWRSEKSQKDITKIKKDLHKIIDRSELLEKYESEMTFVMKSRDTSKTLSSVGPDTISVEGEKLLSSVYAKCRKDGSDKEKSAKIAWNAVEKAGIKSFDKVKTLNEVQNKLKEYIC